MWGNSMGSVSNGMGTGMGGMNSMSGMGGMNSMVGMTNVSSLSNSTMGNVNMGSGMSNMSGMGMNSMGGMHSMANMSSMGVNSMGSMGGNMMNMGNMSSMGNMDSMGAMSNGMGSMGGTMASMGGGMMHSGLSNSMMSGGMNSGMSNSMGSMGSTLDGSSDSMSRMTYGMRLMNSTGSSVPSSMGGMNNYLMANGGMSNSGMHASGMSGNMSGGMSNGMNGGMGMGGHMANSYASSGVGMDSMMGMGMMGGDKGHGRGKGGRDPYFKPDVCKVVVRKMPFGSTQEKVRESFNQFGVIQEISDIKQGPAGEFCFIVFDCHESAKKCVSAGGVEVNGKWCDVKSCGPNGNVNVEKPQPTTVFAGGLPWDVTEESISLYFSAFGPVTKVDLKRSPDGKLKGYCFVSFADEKVAEAVMEFKDHMIDGKAIDVKSACPGLGRYSDYSNKVVGMGVWDMWTAMMKGNKSKGKGRFAPY